MTVEIEFSLPYTLPDTGRLEAVEAEYAENKSVLSPELLGNRTVKNNRVVFRGDGSESDYSERSRRALLDAMEAYFNDAILEEFRDL